MKLRFLFVFLFISSFTFGQKEYALSILDSLCSSRYDGRGYVNNGDNRAADFIIRELKKIGVSTFKNRTFEQKYKLSVNTFPNPIQVIIDNDTLVAGADYILDPSSGTAQGDFEMLEIDSKVLETMYNGNVDLKSLSKEQKAFISDKIFAFNFTDITDNKKRRELKEMAKKAMEFVPVIWVEKNKLTYSVGRNQMNYPLIVIDSSKYRLARNVNLTVNNVYKPQYETKNVIGMIPGKKKKKYVVFSAHFDHLGRMGANTFFPGANDNASGTAMLLSLAKHYKQHPPEYSIVFCFFSGEEAGLVGSKYFVEHPYFKLKRIKFVLNIDIMGGAEDGITLVNATKHPKTFNKMVAINAEKNYLKKVKKRGPTSNSDHYFFAKSGVPAFFIYAMGSIQNYHDIYDSAENTPLNKFDEVQSLFIDFVSTL